MVTLLSAYFIAGIWTGFYYYKLDGSFPILSFHIPIYAYFIMLGYTVYHYSQIALSFYFGIQEMGFLNTD